MRAIILAGGKGTRLAPYTTAFPKPLMPVCGTPILELIILRLHQCGFDDLTLCVGYLAHLIEAYFGDGSYLGVKITYSREGEPLGTAGPLSLVPPSSEPFLVVNADVLSTLDYCEMYQYHCQNAAALTVGVYPKRIKIDLGVLNTNGENEVIEYVEKPELEYQVSMGVYVVDPVAHLAIGRNERLDLPQLVTRLLARGQRVLGYRFDGLWLDIGKPTDFEQASIEFMQNSGLWQPDVFVVQPAPIDVLREPALVGVRD
jgi:NDP-mannose synthase